MTFEASGKPVTLSITLDAKHLLGVDVTYGRFSAINPRSLLAKAGLRTGDQIVSIGTETCGAKTNDEIRAVISRSHGAVDLIVERPNFTSHLISKDDMYSFDINDHESDSRPTSLCEPIAPMATHSDHHDDCDYSIFVLGKVGAGKSTLGNFLSKKDVFKTAFGMNAVTTKAAAHNCLLDGKKVKFIDTPGFSDGKTDGLEEMAKAFVLARNGVHAIVLCINPCERFDQGSVAFLGELNKLESLWSYAFVVFTQGRKLGKHEEERRKQLSEMIDGPNSSEELKKLLQDVANRYIIFESTSKRSQYWDMKSKELVAMVKERFTENGEKCYTNRFFQWAKDKYEKANYDEAKATEMMMKENTENKKRITELQESMEKLQASATDLQSQVDAYENFRGFYIPFTNYKIGYPKFMKGKK